MPDEPTPVDDTMEEASALSTAIIDRLAALDDGRSFFRGDRCQFPGRRCIDCR
jgi:hypothetical protein